MVNLTTSQYCDVCSRLNGVTVSTVNGTATIIHVQDESDTLRNFSCPEKYQCIGNSEVGRCYPCSLSQACPRSTIANETTFDKENLCPPGYTCNPIPKKVSINHYKYIKKLFVE